MNSGLPVDRTLSRVRSNPVASFFLILQFQTTRDRLGQPLRTVEALGTPAQRVTRFRWHASGQMSHLILENPATGEQVTERVFDSKFWTGFTGFSGFTSGGFCFLVTHVDSRISGLNNPEIPVNPVQFMSLIRSTHAQSPPISVRPTRHRPPDGRHDR
ncbi:MAG: hypothetical protein JNK37_16025 [Verrucomicrobiales bacterium]|nr:hypothetical protein [Verrucomicrobiales bacterium]